MHEERQLSTEAVNLISEYVDNFPRKENTNLEPDNAHDDDSNNDDDDDDDDDKYNNDDGAGYVYSRNKINAVRC